MFGIVKYAFGETGHAVNSGQRALLTIMLKYY